MERIVVIIAGPTCSGKTSLSIQLAKKLNTEIISADSRQIYKYLDIGTAKPSVNEMEGIKHHFIDELKPDENFNASKFENKSLEIIEKLFANDKIPILAGGTGLYIDALMNGIAEEAYTDLEYRRQLIELKEKHGNELVYSKLVEADPVSASKMLPQNWKRVMRALEVLKVTGKPIWQVHQEDEKSRDIKFKLYGINWPREILYKNIETRVDEMMESGLVDEVKSILQHGYSPSLNALNTVGYKEIINYLNGDYDLSRAVELIKRNTRRYAKRQMTWFRRYDNLDWLETQNSDSLNSHANLIFSEL